MNLYEILTKELEVYHGDELDPPEMGREYALVFAASRSQARYHFCAIFGLIADWDFTSAFQLIESCKLIARNVDHEAGIFVDECFDGWEHNAFWLPIGKRLGWQTTTEMEAL